MPSFFFRKLHMTDNVNTPANEKQGKNSVDKPSLLHQT